MIRSHSGLCPKIDRPLADNRVSLAATSSESQSSAASGTLGFAGGGRRIHADWLFYGGSGVARSSRSRSVRTVTALALVACARHRTGRLSPRHPVTLDKVQTFGVTSLGEVTASLPDPGTPTVARVPLANTYAGETFAGTAYLVQAGFVEGEVMAAQYTLPASVFPIRIDLIEASSARGTSIQTTTGGRCSSGTGRLTPGRWFAYSSDDVILPHIVIPPGPARGGERRVQYRPG